MGNMKDCPKCGKWKGFSEFSPDRRGRMGLKNQCKECSNATRRRYYERITAPSLAASRDERRALRSAEKLLRQPEVEANRNERKRAYMRRYRTEKPGVIAAWIDAHRSTYNALKNAGKARRLNAIPGWSDEIAIRQYYVIANFLSVELGSEFHVDHIVPLRSALVQGFHAQNNLSILLGAMNRKKSNRRWPDCP